MTLPPCEYLACEYLACEYLACEYLEGGTDNSVLIVCDHASNALPPGVDLGLCDRDMQQHIAWDIGAMALGKALNREFGFAYIGASYSRLLVDLNRHRDDPAVIPETSDGVIIRGNRLNLADREERLVRYYDSYHSELNRVVKAFAPRLVIAMHSFTNCLAGGEPRPWHAGVLYNRIEGAAKMAIALLAEHGLIVGDQQPYSGKQFYATMEKHAEAFGIPCACIEIRQDLVSDETGIARFSAILGPIFQKIVATLA